MPMDPNNPNEASPALFMHCCTVWDEMNAKAEDTVYEGQPVRMYEGYLTRLFEGLHLSVPYYSSVMRMLKQMDCVRQLQRGGGGSKSKWAVMQRPTEDLWKAAQGPTGTKKKVAKDSEWKDSIVQMLNDMRKRVENLERALFTPPEEEKKVS